jgi:hypothetical protein
MLLLGFSPSFDLLGHRFEIPLHSVDADGERVVKVEVL